MFDHGRAEVAAALFTGQGHVMYMKGQEGVEQDQAQSIDASNGQEEEKEQSHGR